MLQTSASISRALGSGKHTFSPRTSGPISRSNEKGASFAVEFDGTKFTWFTKLGDDGGKAGVSIDGQPAVVIDTYSADDIWGVGIFEQDVSLRRKAHSEDLCPGPAAGRFWHGLIRVCGWNTSRALMELGIPYGVPPVPVTSGTVLKAAILFGHTGGLTMDLKSIPPNRLRFQEREPGPRIRGGRERSGVDPLLNRAPRTVSSCST